VGTGDGLAPVLAVGEVVVHVGGHRPRPVQGDQGADVLEARGGQGPHEGPHGPALQLEHAHRVAPPEHLEGLLVVERDAVDVRPGAGGGGDQVERLLDHRQVAQAQEVHLEQAQVGDAVHLVLGDDGGVGDVAVRAGLALDGQVLGERLAGDDHGGGVDAVLAAQALEAAGHVDDLLGLGVRLVQGPQLGGHLVALFVPGQGVQAGGQGGVAAHDQRRHELGDAVADRVRVTEDA
jgi:hypothetical protein